MCRSGFVPYRGTALVANDLIGGHIGLGIVDPPPSQAAIRDGRIKGLAISSKRRFDFFPDIPTFDEQGLKGYEVSGWFGMVAPAATPPDDHRQAQCRGGRGAEGSRSGAAHP